MASSKWATARMAELIKAQASFAGSATADRCEGGEATVLFLRGKKRARFEFEDLRVGFTCRLRRSSSSKRWPRGRSNHSCA